MFRGRWYIREAAYACWARNMGKRRWLAAQLPIGYPGKTTP